MTSTRTAATAPANLAVSYSDAIDAYRAAGERAGDGEERLPATPDLDRCAVWASSALSALFTSEDVERPFRFTIRICSGVPDAPGDYVCEIGEDRVDLEIYRVPRRLADAPEEFRSSIFLFLCADAYMLSVQRDNPGFDWGIDDPARSMALDALGVSPEATRAAARSVWN